MQRYAEESPLVPSPRRREDSLREVEERTIDPGAVGQINPHVAQLLRDEEAMSSIVCVDHGYRVTETVGNFLQAQLQAAFGILTYRAQVRI